MSKMLLSLFCCSLTIAFNWPKIQAKIREKKKEMKGNRCSQALSPTKTGKGSGPWIIGFKGEMGDGFRKC